MKRINSFVWAVVALMAVCVLAVSCSKDDDKKEESKSSGVNVTILVPEHPDAMNYFDYKLEVFNGVYQKSVFSKTITSADYKDFSELSSGTQDLTSTQTKLLPDGTRYCEISVNITDVDDRFSVMLQPVVKTGAAEMSVINVVVGYYLYYNKADGSSLVLKSDVHSYCFDNYKGFIDYVKSNDFIYSGDYFI